MHIVFAKYEVKITSLHSGNFYGFFFIALIVSSPEPWAHGEL